MCIKNPLYVELKSIFEKQIFLKKCSEKGGVVL